MKLTGDGNEINRFRSYVMGDNGIIDFNTVLPQEEWNSKSNALESRTLTETNSCLHVVFHTVVNPPITVYEKASELFKTINFEICWAKNCEEFVGYGRLLSGEGEYNQPDNHSYAARTLATNLYSLAYNN